MDQQAAEIFVSNWRIYQKVVSSDYMFHHKFGILLGDHLHKMNDHLRILDLGCGDASVISPLLDPSRVLFYKGIDLSAPALDLASVNLKATGVDYELAIGPMEELIQKEDRKFNIVYSSYSIHHLQDQQKRELLHVIKDRLEDGGIFIWTDVFRLEGQSREQYLKAYMKMITEDWTDLAQDEKKLIDDHIHNFDYPPAYPDAISWLDKCDLNVISEESGDRFHKTLVSKK